MIGLFRQFARKTSPLFIATEIIDYSKQRGIQKRIAHYIDIADLIITFIQEFGVAKLPCEPCIKFACQMANN
jgi:hypothetical protein